MDPAIKKVGNTVAKKTVALGLKKAIRNPSIYKALIDFCFTSLEILMLDFDFIERKKNHVPRYMEWVAAWGLLVTLIWVYVEALRIVKRIVIS